MEDPSAPETVPAVPGLTNARGVGLERFAIRTREHSVTLAAWRLHAAAEEGSGWIALVDAASGRAHYRGEGVFLGWAQDRLASAYAALVPRGEEPPLESNQLG